MNGKYHQDLPYEEIEKCKIDRVVMNDKDFNGQMFE